MKTTACASCGIYISMPDQMYEARLDDHRNFWCPNGHTLRFNGPSPHEQEIDRLRDVVASQRATINWYQEELTTMARRRAAMEGVATKRWLKIKSLQYRIGALENR